MSSRPVLALAGAASAALLLAGCGASPSDQSADGAQAAYEAWFSAVADGDTETACGYMSDELVTETVQLLATAGAVAPGADCATLVSEISPQFQDLDESLSTELVTKSTAAVTATSTVDGEESSNVTPLVYTDGSWELAPLGPSLGDLADLTEQQLQQLEDELGGGFGDLGGGFGDLGGGSGGGNGGSGGFTDENGDPLSPELQRELEKQMNGG